MSACTVAIDRARAGWLHALLLVLLVAGCRVRETDAPLGEDAARAHIARLQRHLERHPGDVDGWRDLAHLHWLHVGETDKAVKILDRLATEGDATARLSRTIIAHTRFESEPVWVHATALIASAAEDAPPAERALRRTYAESAARLLADVRRDTPRDDERFVAFFDGLELARLPPAVGHTLLSARASIERRVGDEHRRYYDAQGCVRAWAVGPVEGHLGGLELSLRDADRSFTRDAGASLAVLSCAVRVWNPEPRAGIRRLRTWLEPTARELRLELSGQEDIRAYLDGVLVHRTDVVDRWPARSTVLELEVEPGPHVLELRTAIPADRAWLLVRATDGAGRPVQASATAKGAVANPFRAPATGVKSRVSSWPRSRKPVAGPIYAPLRHYLALADALAGSDSDSAETHADRLRAAEVRFAAAWLLVAGFEDLDPSRGRDSSASRRQLALERALAIDPAADRARLLLLEHRLGEGGQAEVVEQLERLGADRLDTVEGHLLRWRAYQERGSDYLAERALARAVALDPAACDVLLARRRMAQRLDQAGAEDEITRALERCPGTLELRSRLARTRGNTREADQLLAEHLSRVPDDIDAIEDRVGLALTEARHDDALALLESVLELAPFRASANVTMADVLAHTGRVEPARAQVLAAIERLPHNGRLREIGESLGIPDPLMTWRVDGGEVLDSYRRGGERYEGVKEVLVLDRDVAEVYANAGQRHLIHQIAELSSKDALDTYGEIELPEGARVLSLHSIKPDGTVLEPESIAGKDGLSLRNLEIGDFVEMEYVLETEPFTAIPGHVDLSRFRFQSLDTPYHRSELVVLAPREARVRVESRNGAPTPRRSERDGQQVLHFLAERMPRRGSEPQSRSLIDELPMVRVYTDLDVATWLETVAMQMRTAQRTNPALRRQVAELVEDARSDLAKVHVIHAWVMNNVDEEGDLSTPATRTLAARAGNRLMLLRAMVRAAGLRSEVWLARDRFGPRILRDGHPMVEAFEAPVLAVWVDRHETPLILSTIAKAMAPGYLLPAYSGTQALRVRLADEDGPPGRVRMPKSPSRLADRRSYELELELDARGNGSMSGTIELQGMEALLWRSVLDEVDAELRGERFQEGELSVLAGGANLDLVSLDIEHEGDLDAPLRLRFRATATGVGVVQGGDLVIPAAIVPMNLGLGYTQLPERRSGMVIPYAPLQEARVSVRFHDASVRAVAPELDLDTAHGSYERRIERGSDGGGSVVIETRATLAPGIVEPSQYAEVVALTRAIQAAEQAVVRVR